MDLGRAGSVGRKGNRGDEPGARLSSLSWTAPDQSIVRDSPCCKNPDRHARWWNLSTLKMCHRQRYQFHRRRDQKVKVQHTSGTNVKGTHTSKATNSRYLHLCTGARLPLNSLAACHSSAFLVIFWVTTSLEGATPSKTTSFRWCQRHQQMSTIAIHRSRSAPEHPSYPAAN
jgi:hypothetical protein